MWENETIVLVTSLKKRILGGEESARFNRIATDNAVPPFIKAIFQNRVEKYLVQEEPMKLQPTPHFKLDPQDLEAVHGRFLEVFREAAIFNKDEVEEILQIALVLRLEYLVKPAATMRKLLYENKSNADLEQMQKVLDPFSKLLPYADMLIKECQRLGYTSIEQDEYSKIIVDLFYKIMNDHSVKTVLQDFSVLTDFLSETKGEEILRIEGIVIQELLADRNLWGFRRAFDVEMKLGKKDYTPADLEMTLKRYEELKLEFGVSETEQAPTIDAAPEPPTATIEETITQQPAQEKEDLDIAFEPVVEEKTGSEWDIKDVLEEESITFESDNGSEDSNITPVETKDETAELKFDDEDISFEPIEETEPLEAIKSDNIDEHKMETVEGQAEIAADEISEEEAKEKSRLKGPMRIIRRDQPEEISKQKENEVEKQPEPIAVPPGPYVTEMIDTKTEKVLVKKLFDGDKDSYKKLISQLEEAESWRVAKILIDNELFKRDVDPFSREAIKLVDIVYGRFYPEEGVGGV